MNAVQASAPVGNGRLKIPKYPPIQPPEIIRTAVFGSFHGGYQVLKELSESSLESKIQIVGVATDDPSQPFTNANRRLWKYPHTRDEELMVRRLADHWEIPVYTGRVSDEIFFRTFALDWCPDLCLMATFGQKIPERLFEYPLFGFYNFHHSDVTWPSYPGPDPIAQMQRDGKSHVVITMHEVNEIFDGGRFVGRSHRIPLPRGANAVEVHRVTWPQLGPFIHGQVARLTQISVPAM